MTGQSVSDRNQNISIKSLNQSYTYFSDQSQMCTEFWTDVDKKSENDSQFVNQWWKSS